MHRDSCVITKFILRRVCGPSSQKLPGKVEFDYLPENCQAVLMLPVREASAVVVVGTNRARAFTPKDIVWMKGLSEKAAYSLHEMEYA